MDRQDYLRTLQDDSSALLAAARAAPHDAPVPGCPEWDTADLVWHIGEVHDFWGWIVGQRATDPRAYPDPRRPTAFDELETFAAERAAELHRALEEADPSTPVWSWAPQKDVAFVLRRMAHETAVHRLDAESAAGREHRLDPALAADGIDEFLSFFLSRGAPGGLGGSVHLHCTDAEGEWTIAPGDGELVVTRDHAKADAALRGYAHDLLLVLWRRAPIDTVTVFGDEAVAAALVARSDLE